MPLHFQFSHLDLDVTETVELVLVTIGNKAKRIEEAKRGLGTELVLEGTKGGRGLAGLGGGKGGGGADESSKNGGSLHGY